MNPPTEPDDPNRPNETEDDENEPMTPEEFREWSREHPEEARERLRGLAGVYRKIVRGEMGELTPELRDQAAVLLAKHEVYEKLQRAGELSHAIRKLLAAAVESVSPEDRLAQCNQLMDELTDALLELPEPYRTDFLNDHVPIRDEMRRMKP